MERASVRERMRERMREKEREHASIGCPPYMP